MTKADTARLIAVIVLAYPNYDKFNIKDKDEHEKYITALTNQWADFFEGDDSRIVALAIKKHIAVSKWPPSIAEIRKIMADIQNPDIIPVDEAWEAVKKFLYVEGENCHRDIYKVFPLPIAEAITAVGYGNLYALHVAYTRGRKAGLDRLAFVQAYEGKLYRQKEAAQIPMKLREGIEAAKKLFTDGSRSHLENIDRQYIAKKQFYDRLSHPNLYAEIESRETLALETRSEGED